MALFSRKSAPDSTTPIRAFWNWWESGGETALSASINRGDFAEITPVLSRMVTNIHPDLAWETSQGVNAQHQLCVTAAGVAALRPIAERWKRAAPPRSAVWEFESSRQRSPEAMDSQVGFGGTTIELAATTFSVTVDEDRHVVDVTCRNPGFAALSGDGPMTVTFLILDWTLGEDDVGRWIGSIAASSQEAPAPISPRALAEIVDGFARQRGDDIWTILSWTNKAGKRGIASTRTAVRWLDYPTYDQHNAIAIAFREQTPEGLPEQLALDRLRELEDEIVGLVGPRGMLVAHETMQGVRTLHVYTDSADQNATDIVRAWAKATRPAKLSQAHDPSWTDIRHLAV